MLADMKSTALRRSLLVAALLAAALPFAPLAARADKSDHVEARELLRRGEILPLSAILTVAAQKVAGDVVEVELEHKDAGWQYEVKVLTSAGEVKKLVLDARDGKVLKVKDD
jgi:uncharacterized membrane protein YkoI